MFDADRVNRLPIPIERLLPCLMNGEQDGIRNTQDNSGEGKKGKGKSRD